ncbi:histone-lysine N-methyltransferase SETD8 [Plasmodium inui San Antonio 1]|uniref:Histone-lysine N-methyltransferase SETD8 n=1 Tax=Plasmodium inui San Antonio 1 TaxID=1237626 RepID=W6ZZY9_9APIC|nr:histone-lysine N-methyltransferase SETD8 [Plasmodium inui San Antonio 1]EUD64838.1 histone-lysine N-methyltransferase SETD8 [Plasmodium inui San Antonio 1]
MKTSTSKNFAEANANASGNCRGNKLNASKNAFTDAASVIWIEKEKLDSIIHIPLYSDLSKYLSDLSKHPVKQEKEEEEGGGLLSKIFLLFDDNSCNIALDISVGVESSRGDLTSGCLTNCSKSTHLRMGKRLHALYESDNNKIPLLIYERFYFWSLHFLFEKSKIKRQKLNISSDINGRYGIKGLNKYDEDVYIYTSIYNSAYNRNDDENNVEVTSYSQLGTHTYNEVNKELNISNKDYIKYLYLNDLKNNAMKEKRSKGGGDGAAAGNAGRDTGEAFKSRASIGDPFFQKGLYSNNGIKWYRLKIKIESVEKKKTNENKNQNLSRSKGGPIVRHHFSFNSYNDSRKNNNKQIKDNVGGNRNVGSYHNNKRVFSCEQRTLNNPNSFKKETCDPTFNADLVHKINHFSLIDKHATKRNINNLIKIQKRSFSMFHQENDRNLLDISNDELLMLSSNRRSGSVFDSNKRKTLASCGNQTGKRRKRSNWFYYKSSSNETNCSLDDDDKSTSRGNSVCAPDRGSDYVENKRKKKEEALYCKLGRGDKNGEDKGDDRGDRPCQSFTSCDLACTPSRNRTRNSKEARSPKGTQPLDGEMNEAAEDVAEGMAHAEDSFPNSRIPSEIRAYVRTVNAGESSTEFHSFDVEEEVDGMASPPVVAVGPPENNREKEERQIKTNALLIEDKKSPGLLTKNTKVYQENVDEYNSEFKSIISEPSDQKERTEKIKRRRDHNRETQTIYLNKILNSIVNKEKSHLNCLSKSFKRIEGFYKQNYKIYIIESKDDLNNKRNCFKSDVHAYDLSAPASDDINKELNILGQFKMYLRRCKGEYRPRKYQRHITTGAGKPIGVGKNGPDFLTNVSCIVKKEHSKENRPGDNNAGENSPKRESEQRGTPIKSTLTKMIPEEAVEKAKEAEEEEEAEEAEEGDEPPSSSSQREAINTHLTKQNPPENGIIFYAYNKKNPSTVKELKEGDCLYIKFNSSYDDYDKIRVVKKDDLLQIIVCLMRDQDCLKLSNISTYSPDLLWNLSVHFKNNTYDMELNLEKMYTHFCRYYEMTSVDGRPSLDLQLGFAPMVEPVGDRQFALQLGARGDRQPGSSLERSSERLSECSSEAVSKSGAKAAKGMRRFKSAKTVKRENLKEIEIMKLKDYVSFLDKFLQNVNDVKLKKLKNIQTTEYYKKYEFDRNINKLNKQQLLELFVDRKNEMNTIPLSFLKEKSRNIIYEENIKMNMFACIKIIFDDVKGRCIYAASDLNKFDFVFEYVGELLTHNEAMERERKYNRNKKKGCYMFYFKHENKRYCIDSTEENIDAAINNKDKKYFLRSFARLVNHSKKNSNLIPKVLTVANLPRLFFVASRNIKEGEELLIDYGERNREIIKNNEWLKC